MRGRDAERRRVEGDGGADPGSMLGSSRTTKDGKEGSGAVNEERHGDMVLTRGGAT